MHLTLPVDRLSLRQRALGAAVATGCAYYLASLLGFALRLPTATPSVVWPPNAVLTAALLLTPTAWWPLCLAAALPAHLAAQLTTDWPLPLIVALFLTNCSEALVGAGLARWLARGPMRLDTLRGLAIFFVAVVLAGPFVSNFADAAVVHWLKGEDFWVVWQRRLFSNMLSELTVVPAVAGLVEVVTTRPRRWSLLRVAEASAVAAGLVVTGLLTLTDLSRAPALRLVSAETPFALQLPFLLWACARFDPGGAGLALFVTTEFTVYAAVHSHGPFRWLVPDAAVAPLQLSLTLVTSALLALSTLIAERRNALRELTNRLQAERLVARLSGDFVHLSHDGIPAAFDESLRRLGEGFDLDAVALLEAREGDGGLISVSGWTAAHQHRDAWVRVVHEASWIAAGLSRGETLALPGAPGDGAPAAPPAGLGALGLHAVLAVPIAPDGHVTGGLVLARRAFLPWPDRLRSNVHLVCDVLGNALARKRADDALKRAELDAQGHRRQLAHVTRVALMGELTSSLAHQLNQPLMAIAADVASARRLLDPANPSAVAISEILEDIAEAIRRASEVIRRVREMLRKQEPVLADVDVSVALANVFRLVRMEADARRVTIESLVADEPLLVRGDGVQIQQVLLNLMVNALEAIGDDRAERSVYVSARRFDDHAVVVRVEDSGSGVREHDDGAIFEPFFTTKPSGLGMGLSIARSIVEAHGGSITAGNAPAGGAVFHVTLPTAEMAADRVGS